MDLQTIVTAIGLSASGLYLIEFFAVRVFKPLQRLLRRQAQESFWSFPRAGGAVILALGIVLGFTSGTGWKIGLASGIVVTFVGVNLAEYRHLRSRKPPKHHSATRVAPAHADPSAAASAPAPIPRKPAAAEWRNRSVGEHLLSVPGDDLDAAQIALLSTFVAAHRRAPRDKRRPFGCRPAVEPIGFGSAAEPPSDYVISNAGLLKDIVVSRYDLEMLKHWKCIKIYSPPLALILTRPGTIGSFDIEPRGFELVDHMPVHVPTQEQVFTDPPPLRRGDLPKISRMSPTLTAAPTTPGSTRTRVKFDTSMSAGQTIDLKFRPTGLTLIQPVPSNDHMATGPDSWAFMHGRVVISKVTDTGFSVEVVPDDLVIDVEIDAFGGSA